MTRRRVGSERAPVSRRSALATAVGVLGTLAGCTGGTSFPDADVVAGPGRSLRFEPAELVVAAGDTVQWGFESSGHNVCGRPDDTGTVALPRAADPFGSYGPDESPAANFVPRGETYEHTFETAGEFVYVCYPHQQSGMRGTVRVQQG